MGEAERSAVLILAQHWGKMGRVRRLVEMEMR